MSLFTKTKLPPLVSWDRYAPDDERIFGIAYEPGNDDPTGWSTCLSFCLGFGELRVRILGFWGHA
jgi:hypothetical protein